MLHSACRPMSVHVKMTNETSDNWLAQQDKRKCTVCKVQHQMTLLSVTVTSETSSWAIRPCGAQGLTQSPLLMPGSAPRADGLYVKGVFVLKVRTKQALSIDKKSRRRRTEKQCRSLWSYNKGRHHVRQFRSLRDGNHCGGSCHFASAEW